MTSLYNAACVLCIQRGNRRHVDVQCGRLDDCDVSADPMRSASGASRYMWFPFSLARVGIKAKL